MKGHWVKAMRKGEPFDLESGLPVSMLKKAAHTSWYDFAVRFADVKWPRASANHRKNIAKALTTVTVALFRAEAGGFDTVDVRTALREWALNRERRGNAPADVTAILRWAQRNTHSMRVWTDTATVRRALAAIETKLDGKAAAPSSIRRNRAILHNALEYAVELSILETNPIGTVKVASVKTARAIDKRSVLNPAQARALLDSVRKRPRGGARLHAFFAVLYYAGLRPEEAVALRVHDLTLPETGWGEILAHRAAPEAGSQWTDSGKPHDERHLKGRAAGETRPVPAHPALVRILREYIADPNPKQDAAPLKPRDLLFSGERGGLLAGVVFRRAWEKARSNALTADEAASPLGKRVYDLRHTCLTTWLNSGVPAAQVAAWAGNSVPVLLSIYVNCISGNGDDLKKRIQDALPDA
jgi:integrase